MGHAPGTGLGALAVLAVLALPAPAAAQQQVKVLRDCGATSARAIPVAEPRGVAAGSPNPLAGHSFFVDPTEQSYQDMLSFRRRGKNAEAELMGRIALQPKFRWFGRWTRPNMQRKVREYLNCVQVLQPGSVPLMVVMRHQGQACHSRYTGGGAAEDAATKRWYEEFAEAIGDARVVIGYEPDSIGTIDCLASNRRRARVEVLRHGIDVLSRLPNATIYVEGTAPDWKSPRFTARMLRTIGIHKVRGFMLNVTHYAWTSDNIGYGNKVSRLVGGKPFVVSTSYNGRGPVHYLVGRPRHRRRINVFCNPRFRGLGPPPSANTGYPKVDAFMWINRPGVSGAGNCNGAPAKAGTWWDDRALMFARYATNWVRPPGGTRFGFRERLSLCQLGAPPTPGAYSSVAPERRCGRK
jgi:endoglucanase